MGTQSLAKPALTPAAMLSIGEVSKITGVNTVTLRAWQRRFGLLNPMRTPKGHRLYRESDVELIRQILHWLDAGVSISKIKPLLASPAAFAPATSHEWQHQCGLLLQAVAQLNGPQLQQLLDEYQALYPAAVLQQQLFALWFHQLPSWLSEREDGDGLRDWLLQQLHWRLKPCFRQGAKVALLALADSDPWDHWRVCWLLCQHGLSYVDLGQLPLPQVKLLAGRLAPTTWLALAGPKASAPLTDAIAGLAKCGSPLYLVGQFAPLWPDNQVHQAQDWAQLSELLATEANKGRHE
ncbi:MerR family transcriptional regulator [Shewanella sp. NIFS-20-20]|uniref:MerR family transcriptional regulator n=1 Tax=Shewanella sp. NIFS-20-20 TaxID=2853806 RepID=UPI001C46D671|nr:MerR family transcriptional regulator [Shewanella sp. NIFS-20-20]MBV7314506.1 MerR family transcriptional regulator [Shewanella sp. NIFS-20-20]